MVKYALLIGINYKNSKSELFGCVNDVKAMKALLIHKYKYKEENITMLHDESYNYFDLPTRDNILLSLSAYVSIANEEDELWIHYSGHGSFVKDKNKDECDKRDEVIVPCDYARKGYIMDDDLFSLLRFSRSVVQITFDCCHSGTSLDLPFLYRTRTKKRKLHDKPIHNSKIYMLSACRDKQKALDLSYGVGSAMGAFTSSLVYMLSLHKQMRLHTLKNKINNYMKNRNYKQRCVLTSSDEEAFKRIITPKGIIIR